MIANARPEPNPTNEDCMVATWPRVTRLLPFGNCFSAAAVIFAISAATPPLGTRINIDDPLHVIVSDNSGFLAPVHGCQIFQKLWLRYDWRIDRNGPQP